MSDKLNLTSMAKFARRFIDYKFTSLFMPIMPAITIKNHLTTMEH